MNSPKKSIVRSAVLFLELVRSLRIQTFWPLGEHSFEAWIRVLRYHAL